MKICEIKDCDKKHYAKGYCQRHYKQYKRHGEITNDKPLEKFDECAWSYCPFPVYAKGFCKSHYYMWKRGTLGLNLRPYCYGFRRHRAKQRLLEKMERENEK